MATPKNVILRGSPIRKEAIANAAITPGDLVEAVGTLNIQKHATAGGNARKAFAIEQEQVGNDIDDDIAASDQCVYVVVASGDEVYARVAAGAAAIVRGDALESAGDGTLRKHTAPTQAVDEGGAATYTIAPKTLAIVAYALEAVDNSGGASAVRIRAEAA